MVEHLRSVSHQAPVGHTVVSDEQLPWSPLAERTLYQRGRDPPCLVAARSCPPWPTNLRLLSSTILSTRCPTWPIVRYSGQVHDLADAGDLTGTAPDCGIRTRQSNQPEHRRRYYPSSGYTTCLPVHRQSAPPHPSAAQSAHIVHVSRTEGTLSNASHPMLLGRSPGHCTVMRSCYYKMCHTPWRGRTQRRAAAGPLTGRPIQGVRASPDGDRRVRHRGGRRTPPPCPSQRRP